MSLSEFFFDTAAQNALNSESSITPLPSASTCSKNWLAEICPNLDFQCLTASALSISFEPSTSKSLKTSSTFALTSFESYKYKGYETIKLTPD